MTCTVKAAAILCAAALLAGCQSHRVCTPAGGPAAGPPPPDWREAATDPDHIKLRAERDALLEATAQARAAGFGAQLDADPALFDPDGVQDGATLRPGSYRCRTVTLGTKSVGRPAFVSEPAQRCAVEPADPLPRLRELDGARRITGHLYPDTPARGVFLGTVVLADEASALHYGRDADRDVAGSLERVGPSRWRLVVPRPAWEATALVVEITPDR